MTKSQSVKHEINRVSSTDEILKEIRERLKKKNEIQNQNQAESSKSKVIQYPSEAIVHKRQEQAEQNFEEENLADYDTFEDEEATPSVKNQEEETEAKNIMQNTYKRFGDTNGGKLKSNNQEIVDVQNNTQKQIKAKTSNSDYQDGLNEKLSSTAGMLDSDTYHSISKRLDDAISHFDSIAHHKVEPVSISKDYSEYANSSNFRSGFTMEDLAIEAMLPMIKQWIDKNLETIVTDIVQQEIQAMFAKRKQDIENKNSNPK
jgi:cell pole-organizing protein PopZ